MSQNQTLKISGLYTDFNELSVAPEGALSVANNIDVLAPGTAQPRRGFSRYGSAGFVTTGAIDAIVEYGDLMIAHRGSTIGGATTLESLTSSGTTYGSVTTPDTGYRVRFAQQNENLYMTSSNGIRVLSGPATASAAGGYKGLDLTASTSSTAASFGWANGDQCAWRAVWTRTDAKFNKILGAPSQREVFTATDNTKGIDLLLTIPSGVTTSWKIQIYRSLSISAAAVAAGGTPSEEMYLAKEVSPSAGDITNGYMTVTDIAPESVLGATLYTASSQEGLANGNELPPWSRDLAVYADCLFFADTITKYRSKIRLLEIGGSSGLVADDTIAISGITYTAKAAENIASAQFKVTGSSTTAANIEATAKSLVKVINRYSSSVVYAYYLSGGDDSPGIILLEERTIQGTSVTFSVSRSTCWDVATGTRDSSGSLLMWSKPNQPEHVPLVNSLRVGSKNDPIIRAVPLKEALILFKKSGEVWSLTGTSPNFYLEKLADTVKLEARYSCAVLDNKIFCMTSKGVEVVSSSGAVDISMPIRSKLLQLIAPDSSDSLNSSVFGVAFEPEAKYMLFLPSGLYESYATQAYVYNIKTNAWTRYTTSATCGCVNQYNWLLLGEHTTGYSKRENRNYTFTDFADYSGSSVTVTAIANKVLTLSSGIDTVSVGDILVQSTLFASVVSVNLATSEVTIDSDPGFSATTTNIYKGIAVEMTWAPETFKSPGLGKQFSSVSLLFKSDILGLAALTFATDLDQGVESVVIEGRGLSQWGLFNWGEEPWGGESVRRPLRQWVPRSKQRGSLLEIGFTHTWAYSNWNLQGITVTGEFGSEGVSRG